MSVLTATANLHAVDVLIPALDGAHATIRDEAAKALLRRNSTRGQVEVIRRLPLLGEEARAVVLSQVGRLGSALRQCLVHGDDELRRNGADFVRNNELYDHVPTLLEMIEDDREDVSQLAAETLKGLVDSLYAHTHVIPGAGQQGPYLRNAAQVQRHVLIALDRACSRFEKLHHREEVVESVLALGDPDDFAVKKVLAHPSAECRELAGRLLMTSVHPGVMQLVLDFMSKNYPHSKAFEAIQERTDQEFLSHLLSWFPRRLTNVQQKNFRQIEHIRWIDRQALNLDGVPPGLQGAIVPFVLATGLPLDEKLAVQEWLVRHGTALGRLAAAGVLESLDESTVRGILSNGLQSDDEELQAWATSQLRAQRIPDALELLVAQLDSPLPAVREAARAELNGFGVDLMLEMFEFLPPDVCLRAGKLIEKIDPQCIEHLAVELKHPIRRRRLRGARCAQALGYHDRLLPQLMAMLEDSDALLRRTGVEVLATLRREDVAALLRRAADDPSPRVRESALRGLQEYRRWKQSQSAAGVPSPVAVSPAGV